MALIIELFVLLLLGGAPHAALVEKALRYPLGDDVFGEGFIV